MGWTERISRWDSGVRQAMKGRPGVKVVTPVTMIAACLWDCGEDELAERALTMNAEDHAAIERIEAVYRDPSYPLPVVGQRVLLRHVTALAAVAYFEGSIRPLARNRSRAQRDRPARFTTDPFDEHYRREL